MTDVRQGGSITLTASFYDGPGGSLTDPSSVSLSIYHDGVEEYGPYTYAGATITKISTGVYRKTHTVVEAAETGTWEARWTAVIDGVTSVGTELFTVVSGAYATVAEVAALPDLAREPDVFTDAMIEEGIEYAIELVENETGTSWIYREHVVTLDGDYRDIAYVGIPFLRTIESCTVDGETQDVDGWTVTDDGYVRRDDSAPFVSSIPGRNVSITVTAGATVTPPAEIKWAVRTLARWYVLRLVSRAPDNAIQLTNAEGSVMLAQPGKHGPTALPEVNAVLRRNNHRWPAVG